MAFVRLSHFAHMPWITREFGSSDRVCLIAFFIAFTCIFAAIADERFIRRIPVIAVIYIAYLSAVNFLMTTAKRFLIGLVYFEAALGLIIYNLQTGNHIMLYILVLV